MSLHTDVIHGFYAAFARRDSAAMAACYTPDATFSDPVFGTLVGPRIGAMWQMLCERAIDLQIEVRDVRASADAGSAHWEARYVFSATGRPVHNVIEASFGFANGRFWRHTDSFPFIAWARQALGLKGVLLSWAPPFRSAVRTRAARGLEEFTRLALSPRTGAFNGIHSVSSLPGTRPRPTGARPGQHHPDPRDPPPGDAPTL